MISASGDGRTWLLVEFSRAEPSFVEGCDRDRDRDHNFERDELSCSEGVVRSRRQRSVMWIGSK